MATAPVVTGLEPVAGLALARLNLDTVGSFRCGSPRSKWRRCSRGSNPAGPWAACREVAAAGAPGSRRPRCRTGRAVVMSGGWTANVLLRCSTVDGMDVPPGGVEPPASAFGGLRASSCATRASRAVEPCPGEELNLRPSRCRRDALPLSYRGMVTSVPRRIRTADRRLKRPLLYQAELAGHGGESRSRTRGCYPGSGFRGRLAPTRRYPPRCAPLGGVEPPLLVS